MAAGDASFNLRPITIVADEDLTKLFAQLKFNAGNYVTGGILGVDDAAASITTPPTLDFADANQAGFTSFLKGQTALHASRPPLTYNINIDQASGGTFGITAVLIPGTGAKNFKLKLLRSDTGVELTGGAAIPTSLVNSTNSTIELEYKKNV